MLKATPISINAPGVPKSLRNKAKLVRKLWSDGNLNKLRELRDASKSAQINIYHHSHGRIHTTMIKRVDITASKKLKTPPMKRWMQDSWL